VCSALNAAGVSCGVLMAPILPGLTDSPRQLRATVDAIAAHGATHVTPIVLHLRPGAREWFMRWLAESHPNLVPLYQRLYRRSAYAPADFQRTIADQVHAFARDAGIPRPPDVEARPAPSPVSSWRPVAAAAPATHNPEQLSLVDGP
jgi:DNA repair photolyase